VFSGAAIASKHFMYRYVPMLFFLRLCVSPTDRNYWLYWYP